MPRLRVAKMRRPSAADLVVLLAIFWFICSEAVRPGPGPGIFSGNVDVRGISEMMMVRPSLFLRRKILEEGQPATPNWAESKPDEQEKKWEPKTEDKPKDWSAEENVETKWDSQPKTEEEKKEWKPEEDVEKKWDSQPKAEEENKEWKPEVDVEKKWDSQPKAEEEKKEWNPEEDVEKKWDSQPMAEEEKKEWKPEENVEKKWDLQPKADEQPKKDEMAVNPEETKSGDTDPIKLEEKKDATWQNQEPRKLESKEQQIKVEEPKESESEQEKKEETLQSQEPKEVENEQEKNDQTSQSQEPKESESEQEKRYETLQSQEPKEPESKQEKNDETVQNQEPTESESKQEKKDETLQNQEPKESQSEQQQTKMEEKEAAKHQEEPKGESELQTKVEEKEQQPWKPAEELKVDTTEAEKTDEPKATDEKKSENQSRSNNIQEEKPKEVTKVEEQKELPKVEVPKEELKKVADIKGTIPKVEDKKEEKNVEENNESLKKEKKEGHQVQQVQQHKIEDLTTAVENGYGKDEDSDIAEDYPDFLDELRNFPERFQKTAESVKDHIRYSGLEKYSTQSKELFNQANQQIQESFTPLLGKDYAPFLAYLVSYGLLLLPLVLVTYLLDRIRARYSLQKILLFVNIYLSAYFAALLTVALVLNTEPMNFFMKYSTSSYIFLQLLQAFGYLIYLLLNTGDLISTCSNGRIAAKFSSVLQWVVVVAVGFHYYVTVFHRAMARKAPLTSWKIYGFYSLSFMFLCLFARIERGKKQYTPIEIDDTTDKKN